MPANPQASHRITLIRRSELPGKADYFDPLRLRTRAICLASGCLTRLFKHRSWLAANPNDAEPVPTLSLPLDDAPTGPAHLDPAPPLVAPSRQKST